MTDRFVELTHPQVPRGSTFTVSAGNDYLTALGIEVDADVEAVVLRNPDDVAAPDVEGVSA